MLDFNKIAEEEWKKKTFPIYLKVRFTSECKQTPV